jgi:hypothetical protein
MLESGLEESASNCTSLFLVIEEKKRVSNDFFAIRRRQR